jgi:phage/plasmid primase-like uncharacterized protein
MRDPREDFRAAMLACLGHAPDVIEPARFHRFGTSARRGDSAGWCKLFGDLRGGVFGCYRQGISETWRSTEQTTITREQRAALARQVMTATVERQTQQRQQRAANAQRNAALWANTMLVTADDPVSLYLRRRGLAGPVPEHLRLHPRLTYWDGGDCGSYPAMIAPLIRPDGLVLALHRTYLTADGGKAPVLIVKKLTGAAGPLAGACIPLHDAQHGVIGIAEGIETAQAAYLASGLPTVAAYSASNLAAYVWPAGVRRIAVFADADPAGAAAARSLKARALRAGLSVAVMTPSTPDADWCDVWAQRAGVNPAVTVTASEVAA